MPNRSPQPPRVEITGRFFREPPPNDPDVDAAIASVKQLMINTVFVYQKLFTKELFKYLKVRNDVLGEEVSKKIDIFSSNGMVSRTAMPNVIKDTDLTNAGDVVNLLISYAIFIRLYGSRTQRVHMANILTKELSIKASSERKTRYNESLFVGAMKIFEGVFKLYNYQDQNQQTERSVQQDSNLPAAILRT